MIDIRYHIYSLAAVFFALAIGIVIGTSFAKRLPGDEGDKRTIQRYENSMRLLKREIELSSEGAAKNEEMAKNYEAFCRSVLPIVASDRLRWRNVAIVQTGDYDDLSGSVKRALELAGAQVTEVIDMSRKFPFGDDIKIGRVLRKCGVAAPDGRAANKLFSLVALTLSDGRYAYLQTLLEDAGVAKFVRSSQFGSTKMVVLIGGASSEAAITADTVDAMLLKALDRPDVTVVGCESSSVAASYVPAWSKMGIATVDNADSPMGQIALICALNGEKARFGVKETAERLIPQTVEAR